MKYFVATVFIEHSPITLFPVIEAADAAEATVGADLYLRYARAALELPAHHRDYVGSGYADISWHGTQAWQADWSGTSRTLAFLLDGHHARGGTEHDDFVYVAMNMHWDSHVFELPGLPEGVAWHVFANTGVAAPEDIWEPGAEPVLSDQQAMMLSDRSVCILVGR